MSLDLLLPAPSKQKEVLNRMALNLTMEEYNVKMQTVGQQNRVNNEALGQRDSQATRIEANDIDCVFSL